MLVVVHILSSTRSSAAWAMNWLRCRWSSFCKVTRFNMCVWGQETKGGSCSQSCPHYCQWQTVIGWIFPMTQIYIHTSQEYASRLGHSLTYSCSTLHWVSFCLCFCYLVCRRADLDKNRPDTECLVQRPWLMVLPWKIPVQYWPLYPLLQLSHALWCKIQFLACLHLSLFSPFICCFTGQFWKFLFSNLFHILCSLFTYHCLTSHNGALIEMTGIPLPPFLIQLYIHHSWKNCWSVE